MSNLALKAFNRAFGQYLRWRVPRLERTRRSPVEFQERWLEYLFVHARHTAFGRAHGLHERGVRTHAHLRERVPVRGYDGHAPYIKRALDGERSVLWPGRTTYFAKSSGTTADRSKYLPMTGENLRKNHLRGGWDAMSLYYDQRPDADLFTRKNLVMGGSIQERRPSGAQVGDVSAIMLANFPSVGRPFYTPSFETMLMGDYEAKLEATARESSAADVGMMGGVPNWSMLLMRRILERTGAAHMREVWPNFRLFTHGGISFAPYREQFRDLIGPGPFDYLEIYNASEGYFGLRDDLSRDDLLLLVDSGVYYEFVPQAHWGHEDRRAVPLAEVVPGETYGVVVTTNAGLWRYDLGDAVEFSSVAPPRFRIVGRTQACINTFGEEVMVGNADGALAEACARHACAATEYTVAPVFIVVPGERGAHEWLVEFDGEGPRGGMAAFAKTLDAALQERNSDYAAKRRRGLVLVEPVVHALPRGTFHAWMRERGKLGGQAKVPRLSNSREHVEALMARAGIEAPLPVGR